MFIQEAENLYRLWVPFEKIATSVFLLLTPEGPVLYDCATTAEDVERVILPALERMHIAPAQLRALVISHAHGDHNGGMAMLLQHAPQLKVIARKQTENGFVPKDGETLFGDAEIYDCTMDGVHPNDLGFNHMAQTLYPVLKEALGMEA